MNYASLQTTVAAWMHRNDLAAQIPTFIEMAEARFNRELRLADMEAVDTGTATAGVAALPADFLALRSLASDDKPVMYLTPQEFQRYVGASWISTPPVFTMRDGSLVFQPAGDVPYSLLYYAKIPALSNSATTNWLLSTSPDVYVHAALVQARMYVKDVEGAQMSEQAYASAVQSLYRQSRGKQAPGVLTIRVAA
jgi:hypothetical protein